MAEISSERVSSCSVNPKIHSDSGYGSNESNSQSQRSSGSSKSQQSSLSGENRGEYQPPNSSPGKRQGKKQRKKNKKDKEQVHTGDKHEYEQEDGKIVGEPDESHQGQNQSSPLCQNLTALRDGTAFVGTHALAWKKLQDPIPESEINNTSSEVLKIGIKWQDYIPEDFKDGSNEDKFATVISMNDGMVVYITSSTTNILGFSKDMLVVGRSFIDYVHPKDRLAFATKVHQDSPANSEQFFCRLKQSVTDKTVVYHPFKLTVQMKQVEMGGDKLSSIGSKDGLKGDANCGPTIKNPVYLVVGAIKLKSAYQYANEIPKNPAKFMTRHSATCNFGHMDTDAINYLGHLPQDLVGSSVMNYYHPADMDLLKDTYDAVIQEEGKPFRSKPYRFRVYNGTFLTLETDWSCFINPWTCRLEFVIGQHRVIQGPLNPNVFMPPPEQDEILFLPDNVLTNGYKMQDEIRQILNETVIQQRRKISDSSSSKRRKDLNALMEALLEKMAKLDNNSKNSSCDDGSQRSRYSFMERDSAMLGNVLSPHSVDNSGSNQSSSTEPSYNQLNYRENIQRFFESQPKTDRSDGGGESSIFNKMDPQNQSSMDSDSSNIRNSSGSNESGDCIKDGESIQFGYGSLTQDLLTRHNEDMEKFMIQQSKDLKCKNSTCSHKENSRRRQSENLIPYLCPLASCSCRNMENDHLMKNSNKVQRKRSCHKIHNLLLKTKKRKSTQCDPFQSCGLKRAGNFSCDEDSAPKQPHLDNGQNRNTNFIWPQFSISVPEINTTSSYKHCYPTNSVSSLAPSPFIFGQQCLPQVQLLPAGLVYQPISSFGQHLPTMLMPIGTIPSFFVGPTISNAVVAHPTVSVPILSSSSSSFISLHQSFESIQKNNTTTTVDSCGRNLMSVMNPVQHHIPSTSTKSKEFTSLSLDGSSISNGSDDSMTMSSKSDESMQSEVNEKQESRHDVKREPLSPELSLTYTVPIRDLSEILKQDIKALGLLEKQSPLVNQQLDMLYNEVENDGGNDCGLYLDEEISSSSSDGEVQPQQAETVKKFTKKKTMNMNRYNRVAVIYEENTPFPPENLCNTAPILREKVIVSSPLSTNNVTARNDYIY